MDETWAYTVQVYVGLLYFLLLGLVRSAEDKAQRVLMAAFMRHRLDLGLPQAPDRLIALQEPARTVLVIPLHVHRIQNHILRSQLLILVHRFHPVLVLLVLVPSKSKPMCLKVVLLRRKAVVDFSMFEVTGTLLIKERSLFVLLLSQRGTKDIVVNSTGMCLRKCVHPGVALR